MSTLKKKNSGEKEGKGGYMTESLFVRQPKKRDIPKKKREPELYRKK